MKTIKTKAYQNLDTAKKRLIFWLLLFFVSIAIPVYFLLHTVYSQLANETWYRQRNQAELLVERIEQQLLEKLQGEQDRPIAEYSFFNVLENTLLQSTSVNFSPLSQLPPKSDIPGLIGYFQIEPDGSFHIPALPEFNTDLQSNLQSGLSAETLEARLALKDKLRSLLVVHANTPRPASNENQGGRENIEQNKAEKQRLQQSSVFDDVQTNEQDQMDAVGLIQAKSKTEQQRMPVAEEKQNQTFSEEKLQQLNIETSRWQQKRQKLSKKSNVYQKFKQDYRQQSRKETVKIPDQTSASAIFNRILPPQADSDNAIYASEGLAEPASINAEKLKSKPAKNQQTATERQPPVNILSFESEVSPLQLITLDNGHFCFYRNAWNGKSRYIQGFIVNEEFLRSIIQPVFNSSLSLPLSSLFIVYKGKLLLRFNNSVSNKSLLFRRTLLPPFQHMEMIVNSSSLSAGFAERILDIAGLTLGLIICTGFILFYRLSAGQIELAKQQRNFISSVSHELKTPLTSIRMYSEMLRSDWVQDESKKRSYYDFMFFESERLSRLISNVLQLARMDNHHLQTQLTQVTARLLLQQVKLKVAAQIEAANYQLTLIAPEEKTDDFMLNVDQDAFFQIMINLIDNAIKFSRESQKKSIDIGFKTSKRGKQLIFFVRDYGPGVDKQRMKKIFQLFYRAGNELTRTQPGTGIGLALVVQLAESMEATVDLINRSPGAEFQLVFNELVKSSEEQ